MKVNIDSWHYKFMSLYKWARHNYRDPDTDWTFENWRRSNIDVGAFDHSLATFRRYMQETGKFQPIDFCSYWRSVLLWPLLFIIHWIIVIAISAFALSHVTLIGTAMIGGILFVAAMIVALGAGVGYVVSALKEKTKSDGFMKNVKNAIHNPDFCTLMEYEKEETPNA